MKRIILSLILLLGMMEAYAQEWRGFLEMHAGISVQQSDINYQQATFYDVWNPLSFGLNYTLGIKVISQLYAGVGIGGYTSMLSYEGVYRENIFPALYFPVFANVRWIPNIDKKINPYIDLKIGYQMGIDLDATEMWTYYGNYERQYNVKHTNGLFLQPGVGIRFGRESAFNLGLAYNVSMRREFIAIDRTSSKMPLMESINKNYGSIMLTFGADF